MTDENTTDTNTSYRTYHCHNCNQPVVAQAFNHRGKGTYPNVFSVGCDCTIIDSCPYEMTQAETPDSWHIPREDCCAGVDVKELEVFYGGGRLSVADYRCPDCGATYRWDGTMAGFPDGPPTNDDRPEGALTDFEGSRA